MQMGQNAIAHDPCTARAHGACAFRGLGEREAFVQMDFHAKHANSLPRLPFMYTICVTEWANERTIGSGRDGQNRNRRLCWPQTLSFCFPFIVQPCRMPNLSPPPLSKYFRVRNVCVCALVNGTCLSSFVRCTPAQHSQRFSFEGFLKWRA